MKTTLKLERLASNIKMRYDVEPEIENSHLVINAGNLTIDELKSLERYVQKQRAEMEIVKEVTFKITMA